MSYTVPYSFVPGTKARAQEVNANFASVLQSMEGIDANKVNTDLSNITSAGLDVIKNNSSLRNIGEFVFSPIPIHDYGLHLLDGSLLEGNGIYKSFYDFMGEKYHSNTTYNSDAFTVIGSPNITNDGIASGFSTTSNIKITTVPTTNNYTVTGEFTTPASIDNTIPFSAGVTVSGALQILFSLRINTNNNQILLLARNSGGTTTTISNANITASGSTSYKYKVVVNGADCSFYIDDVLVGSINDFCELLPDFFIIGADRNNSLPFSGMINLKYFTIIENGEEIVNGEKVGNYFTDEATWHDTVETYGECGKFVYDENEGTIRLPRIKGLLEFSSNTAESGNIVEAGLPNITGFIDELCTYSSSSPTGAFYQSHSDTWKKSGVDQTLYQKDVNFNASRSSSIYGNSSTVQPQTIKYLVYIVVATTPKTNLQIDLDNIATDLNGKLDADLSNLALTNIKNFDGQWVYKHSAINNNATLNTGKYDVDLSSYLPDGQNKYEVLVSISASQSSSNTVAYLILSSSIIPEAGTTVSFANLGANANSRIHDLITTFPVGTNKTLSYRIGGQSFDSLYIRLCGYRRIGTNG